jgi:hypothetical protein
MCDFQSRLFHYEFLIYTIIIYIVPAVLLGGRDMRLSGFVVEEKKAE